MEKQLVLLKEFNDVRYILVDPKLMAWIRAEEKALDPDYLAYLWEHEVSLYFKDRYGWADATDLARLIELNVNFSNDKALISEYLTLANYRFYSVEAFEKFIREHPEIQLTGETFEGCIYELEN